MSRFNAAGLAFLAACCLAACAADPTAKTAASSEPVAHEYRTGSIIAQREKRPVTEEEKQRAQEMAQEIRSAPQTITARP